MGGGWKHEWKDKVEGRMGREWNGVWAEDGQEDDGRMEGSMGGRTRWVEG